MELLGRTRERARPGARPREHPAMGGLGKLFRRLSFGKSKKEGAAPKGGGQPASAAATQAALDKLQDAEDLLLKKQQMLERQVAKQDETARQLLRAQKKSGEPVLGFKRLRLSPRPQRALPRPESPARDAT